MNETLPLGVDGCILGGCKRWNVRFKLPATGRETVVTAKTAGTTSERRFRSHAVDLCRICLEPR